jgi:hypothetical protein
MVNTVTRSCRCLCAFFVNAASLQQLPSSALLWSPSSCSVDTLLRVHARCCIYYVRRCDAGACSCCITLAVATAARVADSARFTRWRSPVTAARHPDSFTMRRNDGSAAQQPTAWKLHGSLLARESDAASVLLQPYLRLSLLAVARMPVCRSCRPHWSGSRSTNDSGCVCLACCYRVIVVWCWSSAVHCPPGLRGYSIMGVVDRHTAIMCAARLLHTAPCMCCLVVGLDDRPCGPVQVRAYAQQAQMQVQMTERR